MNRLVAPYTKLTPKRDDALLPLTSLIRYQDEPVAFLPAQLVLQLVALTVAVTVTAAPELTVALIAPPVEALARRLTPSQAATRAVVEGLGVGVGVGAGVGVGVGVGIGDGVGLGDGVGIGDGVGLGLGVAVGAGVSVGAGVAVATATVLNRALAP
jgi:UDP-3-O-[3-hydroxymyristoyl] glucosamine N-acyltransferase